MPTRHASQTEGQPSAGFWTATFLLAHPVNPILSEVWKSKANGSVQAQVCGEDLNSQPCHPGPLPQCPVDYETRGLPDASWSTEACGWHHQHPSAISLSQAAEGRHSRSKCFK